MNNGWITLHRKLLKSPYFKDAEAVQLWIWLLLSANHKPGQAVIGTKVINVKRGQLVTGRKSMVVEHRAKELGIDEVWQGIKDKKVLCKRIIGEKGLKKEEVCCIGDDLPDLAMFMEAGLRIAVADGVEEVREEADFVTDKKGGYGAVREACEWILKSKGAWPKIGFTEQSGG